MSSHPYDVMMTSYLPQVTVEFHQDDDNDLSLVEMRFYVPNPGNEEEVPADRVHKNVMKYADVIKATGDVIVKFEQVLLQTPRCAGSVCK